MTQSNFENLMDAMNKRDHFETLNALGLNVKELSDTLNRFNVNIAETTAARGELPAILAEIRVFTEVVSRKFAVGKTEQAKAMDEVVEELSKIYVDFDDMEF